MARAPRSEGSSSAELLSVQTQPEPVLSGYRTLFGGPRVSTGSVKNRFPGIYQAQTVFFLILRR